MKVLGIQHNGFWGDRPCVVWGLGMVLLCSAPAVANPQPRPGDAARLGGSLGVTVRPAPPAAPVPPNPALPSLPRLPVASPPPLDPAARLPGTFATDPVPAVPLVWDDGRETRSFTNPNRSN